MLGLKHPFTRALYEKDGEGNVRVTTTDGKVGIFSPAGLHLSGQLFEADPQLCGWIGGPKVTHHRLDPEL